MVERRLVSKRPRSRGQIPPLSPSSLPPRWGEGVAPPSTPHYTQNNTPETSPRVNNEMQISPDSEPGDSRETCPSSGAELLHDLHRRLMAQSVNGTLPRRPGSGRHGHRKTRGQRQIARDYLTLPAPDLLPSSAFNHPSRHTQYSVTHETRDSDTTSDCSPSPPLPSTSLSYPSPPLLRSNSQPLTSTMLGSPESSSGGSQLSHVRAGGQHNSPASPDISSLPQRYLDVTPYQNIENGIAYVASNDLRQLPVTNSGANLSRFNVSPPSSACSSTQSQQLRNVNRPVSRNKLKRKTVSWVADRKVNAKYISDDRKVVKNQVEKLKLKRYLLLVPILCQCHILIRLKRTYLRSL